VKDVWRQSHAEELGHFWGAWGSHSSMWIGSDKEEEERVRLYSRVGGSAGLTRKEKNKAAAERKCQTSWSSKKPSKMHGRFFSRDSAGVS